MITRPMLAATKSPDLEDINYPTFASPKIDGIRCLVVGGRALSRSFKPIPNNFVRSWIESNLPEGVDGELLIPGASFNEVQSAIMSEDGEPNFEYRIFDHVITKDEPFIRRFQRLMKMSKTFPDRVHLVPHDFVYDAKDLAVVEEVHIRMGWEGTMLRHPDSPYKEGRATEKEQYLLKLKRWADAEAVVDRFEEQMRNENEAEVSEIGLTKRTKKKGGLVPAGTLGTIIAIDPVSGSDIRISAGAMTKEQRQFVWDNQSQYVGRLVTYKFQPAGMKANGLPRFPVFKGFRDQDDL